MKISIDDEECIGQSEVLRLLSLKRYMLYRKIRAGEVPPPIKPDERAYWKRSEIDAYLEGTRKEGI
jgi:predicted DNA-binding transcriptional regulator AlpA